ncbi:MAG: hypothetical protein IAE87_17465 [Rhodobacteraceae bacterium]|jgi:hypothetical protein|nr:hypothetical protein [Paracoccaceae bacterium]
MRALAVLAAAAMVVSLFLPWLGTTLPGARFVPWDLIRNLNPDLDTAQRFVVESPGELVIFLATFVLAALFVVLSLIGLASRLLAVLTGGLAVGIVAYGYVRLRDGAIDLGLPLPVNGTAEDLLRLSTDILGMGAWAWIGGAAVLLVAGLVGFGRR